MTDLLAGVIIVALAAEGLCLGIWAERRRTIDRLRALRDRIADEMPIEDGTVIESRTVALGVMGEVLSELER